MNQYLNKVDEDLFLYYQEVLSCMDIYTKKEELEIQDYVNNVIKKFQSLQKQPQANKYITKGLKCGLGTCLFAPYSTALSETRKGLDARLRNPQNQDIGKEKVFEEFLFITEGLIRKMQECIKKGREEVDEEIQQKYIFIEILRAYGKEKLTKYKQAIEEAIHSCYAAFAKDIRETKTLWFIKELALINEKYKQMIKENPEKEEPYQGLKAM